jgi:hypothetical protein
MADQAIRDTTLLFEQKKEVLKKILEKYNLLDKIDLVEKLIKQVLNNEISSFDLDQNLVADGNLDLITAATIGLEISQEIIEPIKKGLDKESAIQKEGGIQPFSEDEIEKEIKEISSSIPLGSQIRKPFETILEEVIKRIEEETGWRVSADEILKTRYRNIIISFLKDVRDEMETRQVLKRPQKIGGLELDEPTIDQIIMILKQEKVKIVPEISPKKEEKKPALAEGIAAPTEIARGAAPALVSEEMVPPETIQKFELGTIAPPVKEPPAAKSVEIEEKLIRPVTPPFEETLPQPEPPKEEFTPRVVEAPKTTPSALEEITKEEITSSEPVITVRRPPPTKRPIVEEVKVRPKVYGPTDELRSLRLADWRRLGGGREAAERIYDKISLLGEDSLAKKAQGIRAWKESEIHLLYLEIGTEAVDKGKTVEEVIRDREREGRPTLTMEDFDAIGELNQKLRF